MRLPQLCCCDDRETLTELPLAALEQRSSASSKNTRARPPSSTTVRPLSLPFNLAVRGSPRLPSETAETQEAYKKLGKSGLAAGVKVEFFQEIPKL